MAGVGLSSLSSAEPRAVLRATKQCLIWLPPTSVEHLSRGSQRQLSRMGDTLLCSNALRNRIHVNARLVFAAKSRLPETPGQATSEGAHRMRSGFGIRRILDAPHMSAPGSRASTSGVMRYSCRACNNRSRCQIGSPNRLQLPLARRT
jgi:hypothetical protein